MDITNKTCISLSKIKKIIQFVRPAKIKIPRIYIRDVSSLSFYGYFDGELDKVYVSIGEYYHFPLLMQRSFKDIKKGYLSGFNIKNREEALVYVLAHELRHKWQWEHPDLPKLGDMFQSDFFSERDTDTYALWKLNNWRKRKKK